ncbi:hypothetical protein [Kocuria kalidii]|uniref:hypothetical protein n=1 Tax=Kocuria kalidii TaxID=3376283 RepID=UPI0037A9181B
MTANTITTDVALDLVAHGWTAIRIEDDSLIARSDGVDLILSSEVEGIWVAQIVWTSDAGPFRPSLVRARISTAQAGDFGRYGLSVPGQVELISASDAGVELAFGWEVAAGWVAGLARLAAGTTGARVTEEGP